LELKIENLDKQYIPIDFDSYSIEDKELILSQEAALEDETKIWRISSLTAFTNI